MAFFTLTSQHYKSKKNVNDFTKSKEAYGKFSEIYFEYLKKGVRFEILLQECTLDCLWRVERTEHGFLFQRAVGRDFPLNGFLPGLDGFWSYKQGNNQTPCHWERQNEKLSLPQRMFLSEKKASRLVEQLCTSQELAFDPNLWEHTECAVQAGGVSNTPASEALGLKQYSVSLTPRNIAFSSKDMVNYSNAVTLFKKLVGASTTPCVVTLTDRHQGVSVQIEHSIYDSFLLSLSLSEDHNGFYARSGDWFHKAGNDQTPYRWFGGGDFGLMPGRFFHTNDKINQFLNVLENGFKVIQFDPDYWENLDCFDISAEEPSFVIQDQLNGEQARGILEQVSGQLVRKIDESETDESDFDDFWTTIFHDYYLNEFDLSDENSRYEIGLQDGIQHYRYLSVEGYGQALSLCRLCFLRIKNIKGTFQIRVKNIEDQVLLKIVKSDECYSILFFVGWESDFKSLKPGYWLHKVENIRKKCAKSPDDRLGLESKYLLPYDVAESVIDEICRDENYKLRADNWDYFDDNPLSIHSSQ